MDYSDKILDKIVQKEQQGAIVRIVDDDASTRRALGFMLQVEGYSTRIYDSAEAFLDQDDVSIPGCLILDVRMPNLTGLQLQREIQRLGITLPIVFVTGYADIDVAVESMRRGAVDFLLKPVESEKLLHAIQWALHADRLQRQPPSTLHSAQQITNVLKLLTPREKDVIRLAYQGISNAQAAQRLGISERTIEGHRLRIYKKLGIHTDAELLNLSQEIKTFLSTTEKNP